MLECINVPSPNNLSIGRIDEQHTLTVYCFFKEFPHIELVVISSCNWQDGLTIDFILAWNSTELNSWTMRVHFVQKSVEDCSQRLCVAGVAKGFYFCSYGCSWYLSGCSVFKGQVCQGITQSLLTHGWVFLAGC